MSLLALSEMSIAYDLIVTEFYKKYPAQADVVWIDMVDNPTLKQVYEDLKKKQKTRNELQYFHDAKEDDMWSIIMNGFDEFTHRRKVYPKFRDVNFTILSSFIEDIFPNQNVKAACPGFVIAYKFDV